MKAEKEPGTDADEKTGDVHSPLSLDVIASALRQPMRRKCPPPSFTQAPAMPLPLWQRVVISAVGHLDDHVQADRKVQTQKMKLARELQTYHATERERVAKLRAEQQDARARLGGRLSGAARRFWRRRGDAYQSLVKVEFDAVKHFHDKRKQEDLLRDTEVLTKKLLDSILDKSRPTGQPSPQAGEGETTLSESSLCTSTADDDDAKLEVSLRLLDTQEGKRPLRDYQRSALSWMVHLYENKLNGILADEMGLGKTVQTIALLCYFAEKHNDWGPHLIVVPTTVVLNWAAELQRWAPGFKVMTYIGSQKERLKLRKGWMSEDAFHICITSYNLVVHDRAVFRRRPWGFLVLDEAHQVKNFMSQKWQALFDLQAEYRLLLTGTPLQNSIMELWSLFHFLLPFASAFQSNEEFKEWFSNPLDEMITGKSSLNEDIVRRLQALIRPFMLRRLKKDVESQLPTKTEKVVLCRLSRRQRGIYDDYMQLTETRNRLRSGGAGGVLSVLLGLRKVCDHPDLFEERPTLSPFVMGYDDAIEACVPRRVLIRGVNPYFSRFNVEVDDLNDERCAYHNRRTSEDNAAFDWLPSQWMDVLLIDHVFASNEKSYASVLRRMAPGHRPLTLCCLPQDVASLHDCRCAHSSFFSSCVAEGGALAEMCVPATPLPLGEAFVSHVSPSLAALYGRAVTHVLDERAESYARFSRFQAQRRMRLKCAMRSYYTSCCLRLADTFREAWLRRYNDGALCPTVQARVAAALPIIKKVAVYVPAAVVSRPASLVWRQPVPLAAESNFRAPTREELANTVIGFVLRGAEVANRETPAWRRRVFDGASFAEELWPIHARRYFNFPDKRLLIHDCGKLQFLETALKQLRQDGHRMLIFTQFTHMLNILERFLALVGVKYMRLDGSTRVELRQELVDRFNTDPRVTCMILSTRSGGIGLNLTGADTVIFYDSDWNPTMDLQAQDRCHRIGQTKPVTIYRLVSEHTVEESILQKARERKKLNNVVIRGGQFHAIAGVSEEAYEDSAAAYAALAEPVNLRSFFHDLDEDATVADEASPTAASSTGGKGVTLSEDDFVRELGLIEDDEDRHAQRTVEQEMQARAAEEAADNSDEDSSETGHGHPRRSAASARLPDGRSGGADDGSGWYPAQEHDEEEERDEDRVLFGEDNDPAQIGLIRQAVRKRQREQLSKASTPVEQVLTARFAVCRLDDAQAQYDKLCEAYEARLTESGALPPFRKRLRL